MSLRKPDFFIVGAPRSGTTALYEYLRTHPLVFMPALKEPHFFSLDFPRFRQVTSMRQYLDLFPTRSRKYRVMGEASVTYLISRVAAKQIRDFNRDARLIVMLRNPVDMIRSWHSLMVGSLDEDETDFGTAWRLQEDRRKGVSVPRTCREPAFLQYAEVGKLGAHVERLLEAFPREQVKFVVFESFAGDTKTVYESVLSFLGVPSDGRDRFPRANEMRQPRVGWLHKLVIAPPAPLAHFLHLVRKMVGVRGFGILRAVQDFNSRPIDRGPLAPAFVEELKREFRQDVEKLSVAVGRDLTPWVR